MHQEDTAGEQAGPVAPGDDGVRLRVTTGAALLAARTALILALGIGANLALARLLEPRDFGLVALGAVLLVLGGNLVQAGLGAALVRRPEPPTKHELGAVNGLQLAATSALSLVFALIALPFGRDGLVVIAMVASLPISILRTPSVIMLERSLSYRAIATVDIAEAVAFYAWAIATVAAGWGVWGMATALLARAVVGTVVMTRIGPLGLMRPRWSWAEVRPLLGFGAKLQLISLMAIGREQGLNVGVVAIGGIATLGVWSLAYRVLQAPAVILSTVGRVTYPAMSRMLAAGRDPRGAIEHGVASLTVVASVVAVAIAGFAPGLPGLVGQSWDGTPAALGWSCVALVIGGPIYIMTVGYLYAADQVGVVIRSMLAFTLGWFAVTLPLVSTLGAPAMGIGWTAGASLNAGLLAWQTGRLTGASIAAHFLPPALVAAVAGAAGWLVATSGSGSVSLGVAGALAGEAVLIAGIAVVRRSLLCDVYDLIKEASRGVVSPPPDRIEDLTGSVASTAR